MNLLRSRLLRSAAPWLVGTAVLLHSLRSLGADANWVTGITEPIKDVTLAFPIVGVVGARPLEEGVIVRKDQVIIELDKQLEELDLERKRLPRPLHLIDGRFDRLDRAVNRHKRAHNSAKDIAANEPA